MTRPDLQIQLTRRAVSVSGIVQGVGFRPFVYRLAVERGLTGFVRNNEAGVYLEVEGQTPSLDSFLAALRAQAPPLARITAVTSEEKSPLGDRSFRIDVSTNTATAHTLIAPDTTVCEDCLRELFDLRDRRYRYPFINCTNCGPRYTIVDGIPYDRRQTSMRGFTMCPECRREYDDPGDRRFHAQPNACPACGPRLWVHDGHGVVESTDPVGEAVAALQDGRVVALRGIGGFHLAVDATNETAVRELRIRKKRVNKPFALMARDVAAVARYCLVSPDERCLLESDRRPIVLLKALPKAAPASWVAPDNRYLGFMLPYTPLHYLVLRGHFEALVMTSGNRAEEPIAISNEEAFEQLRELADLFLLHDRDIRQRCDDSIVRHLGGRTRLIRRARGFVPEPIELPFGAESPILACGGELKNTVALARGNEAFLSQHIGDLENKAAYDQFRQCIKLLSDLLEIRPSHLTCDLHPSYLSTRWAEQQEDVRLTRVQHHHAHLVSVMAENGVSEPCLGLILDGTGFGADGTIWGGEILYGDALGFDRLAWLQAVPMPGGEAAVRDPWRMAISWMLQASGSSAGLSTPAFDHLASVNERNMVGQLVAQRINSPLTSSCGRLFDAVSALLGLRTHITFEAEAAIALEMAADDGDDLFDIEGGSTSLGAIIVAPLVAAVIDGVQQRVSTSLLAGRFQRTLADRLVSVTTQAREKIGCSRIGLSGGVYQNAAFFEYVMRRLEAVGFEVLTHLQVPTNDGGIALGQLAVAAAIQRKDHNRCVWQYPVE